MTGYTNVKDTLKYPQRRVSKLEKVRGKEHFDRSTAVKAYREGDDLKRDVKSEMARIDKLRRQGHNVDALDSEAKRIDDFIDCLDYSDGRYKPQAGDIPDEEHIPAFTL